MAYDADIAIIGAGVVGLAVAARLAGQVSELYVLERGHTFGLETSSRHSGVIHSGIYYPRGSLKASLCVRGNAALYEFCERHSIGHRRLGKLVVAVSGDEEGELRTLRERGAANGVEGLEMLSADDLRRTEPNVRGIAALLVPSTGILDSRDVMRCLEGEARDKGAHVAYDTEVLGLDRTAGGYRVSVASGAERHSFTSRVVINCAGLQADRMAGLAGIDIDAAGYRIHYCKGQFFTVGNGKNRLVGRLVYPVPLRELTGVGIHVTLDLDGGMRLGPDVQYVDAAGYEVDGGRRQLFCDSVRDFLPFIEYGDLEPESAGIRPKLQGPGEAFRDFVIAEEGARDLPGLVNLIGIESPGLTAAPAIAEHVARLVAEAGL